MSLVDCSLEQVSFGNIQVLMHVEKVGYYVVALLGLPKTNILRGQAHNVALCIDHAGSSATGANINSNIMVHVYVQFVVGI